MKSRAILGRLSIMSILTLIMVLFLVLTVSAADGVPQQQGGKLKKPTKNELKAIAEAAAAAEAADTLNMRADTIIVDTISGDSIKLLKGARPDTLVASGGILPMVKTYDILRLTQRDSTGKEVKKDERRPYSELAKLRSPIFKDTVSFSRLTMLSFVAPGIGQLYNNQKWKIPVLYGAVGGFAAMSAIAGSNVRRYQEKFDLAVANEESTSSQNALNIKLNNYKTQKTLYAAGAIASYLYFVGDAAINYKGVVDPTRKATILSAIFPGAGQIYNGSYWKLPIVYGGFAILGYIIDFNNRGYQRFKTAYNYATDGDDSTVDEFNGAYSDTVLENTRNSYRRYRDMGIVYLAGFYLLNIIDAHVDAYLRRYDISDNLSMKIEPTVGDKVYMASTGSNISLMGLAMKITF